MNSGRSFGRQRYVDLGGDVADDRAGHLDRRRHFAVDEVQRHAHLDLAVLVDALEIDVQDLVLERMHLHVAQQHLRRGAVELHREDRRVERFVAQRVEQRVVVELDRLRRGRAAVDDAGRPARAAQAAARAATFGGAGKGGEFECHGATPDVCGLPGTGAVSRSGPAGRPRLATSPTRGPGESFEL